MNEMGGLHECRAEGGHGKSGKTKQAAQLEDEPSETEKWPGTKAS